MSEAELKFTVFVSSTKMNGSKSLAVGCWLCKTSLLSLLFTLKKVKNNNTKNPKRLKLKKTNLKNKA